LNKPFNFFIDWLFTFIFIPVTRNIPVIKEKIKKASCFPLLPLLPGYDFVK
jgi:hypothetical protein